MAQRPIGRKTADTHGLGLGGSVSAEYLGSNRPPLLAISDLGGVSPHPRVDISSMSPYSRYMSCSGVAAARHNRDSPHVRSSSVKKRQASLAPALKSPALSVLPRRSRCLVRPNC